MKYVCTLSTKEGTEGGTDGGGGGVSTALFYTAHNTRLNNVNDLIFAS